MAKKIKVCFLLGGFQIAGGISRVVSLVADALAQTDDIDVMTISYSNQQKKELFDLTNIQHQYLFDEYLTMTDGLLKKKGIQRLKKILEEESVDVLVACGIMYYPLAYFANYLTPRKTVFWEHSSSTVIDEFRFQKYIRKFFQGKADALISLTQSDISNYEKSISRDKIFQIYSPIDGKIMRKENLLDHKKILSVGRLTYAKNYEETVAIAQIILEKRPEWTWDIYGDGEEKKELQSLIEKNNLQGKVNLMGNCNDIYRVYGEYDIMAMTSRYEGFPMVLIEAAASGLPLIAYDIKTGPNEIIKSGTNGELIPAFNRAEYIQKLLNLMDDRAKRITYSQNNIEVCQQFSMEKVTTDWLQVFQHLIQK